MITSESVIMKKGKLMIRKDINIANKTYISFFILDRAYTLFLINVKNYINYKGDCT